MPKKKVEQLEEEKPQAPSSQDPAKLAKYIEKLNKARDERDLARREFDGMTFLQDYSANRDCTFSYLRAKKNEDDVRVNSGTAEKKIELMLNELLGMNFQPEVRAYDEHDLELVDLGVDFTDLVRTTNEQETDEDLWEDVYLDLLTQRVALVEECLTDSIPGGYQTGNKKKTRGVKRRVSPLQVYFGDMYIPVRRMNEQPYIVIYDRMLYSEAEVLYGHLPEWKHVKPGSGIHDEYLPWFKYRFSNLHNDEVEVIRYLSSSAHEDDDQVILNSVMMYPEGRKMKTKNGYPLKGAVVKMIPDFAYGKPPIASAKFLQALQDETLRNLIRKMRQAIEPPLGVVKSGKTPTRDMWNPAAVTQGLSGDNFSRLIDHDGVTASEFNMFNLIVQKTEEFIGASNIQTAPGEGKMTATQIIEMQKQAVKMLGLAVLAVMRLKRDATFARLETLTCEYTKPVSEKPEDGKMKKSYRTFDIENGHTSQGETVKKFIAFIDRSLSKDEMKAVKEEEDEKSKLVGKDVRYSFLNVEALKSIPVLFKVSVTPESRDSGSLDKIMFLDRMTQAATIAQLTGKRLNGEKLIDDFERTWKARGLFEEASAAPEGAPQDLGQMLGGLDQMAQGSPQAQDLKAGLTPNGPPLNTLVSQP